VVPFACSYDFIKVQGQLFCPRISTTQLEYNFSVFVNLTDDWIVQGPAVVNLVIPRTVIQTATLKMAVIVRSTTTVGWSVHDSSRILWLNRLQRYTYLFHERKFKRILNSASRRIRNSAWTCQVPSGSSLPLDPLRTLDIQVLTY
jgi:hypothetical protein